MYQYYGDVPSLIQKYVYDELHLIISEIVLNSFRELGCSSFATLFSTNYQLIREYGLVTINQAVNTASSLISY